MTLPLIVPVEVLAGTSVDVAIEAMIQLARNCNCGISSKFNGVEIVVFPGSYIGEVLVTYYSDLRRDVI
jgi:hypothetical protein